MKQKSHRVGAILVMIISSMAFVFAAVPGGEAGGYESRGYVSFSHGSNEIDSFEAPFVSLSLGSEVAERITLGIFASAQLLSDFPSLNMDLAVTETPSAFAAYAGVEMEVRLFRRAFFNPMVHFAAGYMGIAHVDSASEEDSDLHFVGESHFLRVGSGFELNFSRGFSLAFLNGYRFVPHKAVLDMPSEHLSGLYNSVRVMVRI